MAMTAFALFAYIVWTFLLLGAIAVLRFTVSILYNKPANSFKPDGSDVSPLSARLCRAHANCYESFPYIGGLMILALLIGETDVTNSLALPMLIARVLQSIVHIVSTSVRAVAIRFVFFLMQYIIGFYWIVNFMYKL